MANIGYARVSTQDQDLTLQIEQLKAAGCSRIFKEKASGANGDRAQLRRMVRTLGPGDIVMVARLDRLARSLRDLLNLVDEVTAAGAQFKSLGDPWLDTTSMHGELLLHILGALAQFERKLILTRVSAGIARSRANGVQFGRKRRLNDIQKRMIAEAVARGEPMRELGKRFGVGTATIWRAVHGS